MAKEIRCDDVVPGCGFTTQGASEDDVLAKVADHARVAHGVREVTPELLAKVKAAVREK